MAFNFLKQKKHKVALVSVVSFVVVVLVAALLLNQYLTPILSKKVKSAVLKGTDSLYNIDFSSAEVHVLEGRVIFYNITLTPDTAVYKHRLAQHTAPNNLFELHVKRLILANIHPFKLYFKHELDIGRITLNSPEVHMSYQLNHTKDTVITNRTIWQKISKSLKYVHVGDIFLQDVNFKYDDHSGHKLAISELKEMNLQANELLIDSATQTDKSRLLYCKDIIAEINNYKGQSSNGLYNYGIKQLKLSTRTSQLNIEGITLGPVNGDTFFNKTKTDRYTVSIDSLQLNNFDFLSYHKYRTISATSLFVTNGSFGLFNNPNKVLTNENKIKSFPNVALRDFGTDLRVDTIAVKHINISYTEIGKKSGKTGTIAFNNTSGRFLNVTNNKTVLQKNNISTVKLTTRFMDKGKLSLFFTFNLTDKNAAFSYKGHLGPMSLSAVNEATMPLAMIKVTSGKLNAFKFDIKADSRVSKGRVTLLYNDLKVSLLKPGVVSETLRKKLIESLFANIFILKHDNPDKAGEIPRSFNVVYKRPVNSPFFKTQWQTLLTGIKPGVGYDIKTQQAASAKLTERDLKKQNRKIKKEMRQQKRAERKAKKEEKKEQKEAEKKASDAAQ